jgi:hypothetical protein
MRGKSGGLRVIEGASACSRESGSRRALVPNDAKPITTHRHKRLHSSVPKFTHSQERMDAPHTAVLEVTAWSIACAPMPRSSSEHRAHPAPTARSTDGCKCTPPVARRDRLEWNCLSVPRHDKGCTIGPVCSSGARLQVGLGQTVHAVYQADRRHTEIALRFGKRLGVDPFWGNSRPAKFNSCADWRAP